MKWSMDTHKYISEITRTALRIMMEHNITSESEPEEIEAVERDLAANGVYKDFDAARGRVRRALFTYFKAYHCLDEHEHLTDIGRLYAENKLSIREFSFYYIVNYIYKGDSSEYYPAQLILLCLKKLADKSADNAYISAYDFSRLVACENISDLTDNLIDDLITMRQGQAPAVNERNIGYDVWAKMLVQAGLLKRNSDRSLSVENTALVDWVLRAYEQPLMGIDGKINSGILKYIPILPLSEPHADVLPFEHECKAVQAYCFDAVEDAVIEKYIYATPVATFDEMINRLGIRNARGYYAAFVGLERLVGFALAANETPAIRVIGEILSKLEISILDLDEVEIETKICIDEEARVAGGTNILLYGVPGSGKSWTIEHEYCTSDTRVERLVFHPDYTNADFIGQILPVVDPVDKMVTYEFTPGPFTNIVRDAYLNPQFKYVLIIEEVNRGNAPAIFGDVFQLLDRLVEKKTIEGVTYLPGTSEYGITNPNIAKAVYGDETQKVRIPSNLSILGTMNTSDQNVFTLDTAFQRRWRMRLIENTFDNVRLSLANAQILDTGVTWKKFCEEINKLVIGNKSRMASAEDKRLGVYFIHESDLFFDENGLPSEGYNTLTDEINALLKKERESDITLDESERLKFIRIAVIQNRVFAEKVIKYLWDDAFKFNPEAAFDIERMESLEQVIRAFVYENVGANRFDIFKNTLRQALYSSSQ